MAVDEVDKPIFTHHIQAQAALVEGTAGVHVSSTSLLSIMSVVPRKVSCSNDKGLIEGT